MSRDPGALAAGPASRLGGRAHAWVAAALWLALGAGVGAAASQVGGGAAACVAVAGGGELTVAGVGRALFAALATDRARGAIALSGGVCVELTAVGGVLRSDRIDLSERDGEVTLTAVDVAIALHGWILWADRLRADAAGAELGGVVLQGREAVARAVTAFVDLETGAVEGVDVRLVTEVLWIDATRARIDGAEVRVEGAWLTTCDCPPVEADVRVEADSATIDLAATSITLAGAELVTGRLRVPLPDPWTTSAAAWEEPTWPFSVAEDPDGLRGTVVTFAERDLASGARWAWEVASGTAERPPDLGVRLSASQRQATVALVAASDRLTLRWRVARPWGGGWTLAFGQRLEGGAVPDPVRDQYLEARWSGALGDATGMQASVAAFAAASAQTLAAGEVVGARLGVEGRWRWELAPAPGWRPSLVVTAGATAYPATLGPGAPPQAYLGIAPSVVVEVLGARVTLSHLSRWVAGASPFGASLDRVAPAHRSDLRVDLGDEAAAWDAYLATRWDWRPDPLREGRTIGLERLDVGAALAARVGDGELAVRVDTMLAGVVDPRPERGAGVVARIAWSQAGWEFGVGLRGDLAPVLDPWRSVSVFGAVPIEVGEWTWRPFLEVDVAASLRRAAPTVVGHGLDVAWRGCCAVIELGYRHDAYGGTSLRAGLRTAPHELDPARLASRSAGARSAAPRTPR